MSSTGKTNRLALSQFQGTDKPSWLTDYDADMAAIDSFVGSAWLPLPPCAFYADKQIQVQGDLTGVIGVGDEVKFYQSGLTKYHYVVGVAANGGNTLLTLASQITLGPTFQDITLPYFSKGRGTGHPEWFDWSPTFGASGSMTYTSVTATAKFRLIGRTAEIRVKAAGTTGGTASAALNFTPPIPFSDDGFMIPAFVEDSSNNPFISGIAWPLSGIIKVSKYDGSNYGIGSGRMLVATGFYQI
jgi:hypothetical protein